MPSILFYFILFYLDMLSVFVFGYGVQRGLVLQ